MQTALISGGSDGIGKELAKDLVRTHKVIILAKDKEKTETAAKELGCDFVVADVSNPKELEAALSGIGFVDVLVNNAGLWIQGPVEENEPEAIKEVVAVNATGTMLLTHFVLGAMKRENRGRIINIISQAGLYPKKDRAVYTASKWAVTGFTKSLQEELDKTDISVTGVYPGFVHTELFAKSGNPRDLSRALSISDVVRAIRFVIDSPADVIIPEIGVKSTRQ